jgi:arylsulfatase A-like enzyme
MRAEIVARQKALGVIPANVQDAPRPETLPHWDALPENRKRFHARMMEAYAASLSYADHQIGRVIASLKETGADRNTIIIYIQGDNGASAEGGLNGKLFEQSSLAGVTENPDEAEAHINSIGGPLAYNLNTGGWGWAMNAPFPWSKRYASHLGGIRNGMVIDWPGHIPDPGGLRSQFLHVSDIMPTLLELIGIASPTSIDGIRQQRIDGISAAVTLKSATAPSLRRDAGDGGRAKSRSVSEWLDGEHRPRRDAVGQGPQTRSPPRCAALGAVPAG